MPALWLQPHDTVPPRIQSIAVEDSTAATVEFTGPLDPYSSPPFASFRLLALPDSVVVEGASLVTRAEQDSLRARQRAEAERADTTTPKPAAPVPARPVPPPGKAVKGAKAAPDTVGLAALLAQRPALQDRLVIRMPTPFVPGNKYVLEISGLRGLGGATGNVRGGLAVPESKATKADSTARPPAGSPAAGDSTRPR